MKDIYFACTHCLERTPQVYQQGWACLNASCLRFWISVDGSPLPLQLEYNAQFLQLLPPFVLPSDMRDIRPALPVMSAPDGITTTHLFARGWHCPQCGRLSCRYVSSSISRSFARVSEDSSGNIGNVCRVRYSAPLFLKLSCVNYMARPRT